MKKKLILLPPEGLDSNLLRWLEEKETKQWKGVDPVGIDLTKTVKAEEPPIDNTFQEEEDLLEQWDPDAIEEG